MTLYPNYVCTVCGNLTIYGHIETPCDWNLITLTVYKSANSWVILIPVEDLTHVHLPH